MADFNVHYKNNYFKFRDQIKASLVTQPRWIADIFLACNSKQKSFNMSIYRIDVNSLVNYNLASCSLLGYEKTFMRHLIYESKLNGK